MGGASGGTFWAEDDILEKRLFKSIFDNNFFEMSSMTTRAKFYFYQFFGDNSTTRYCFDIYNVLGSPELEIWTATPSEFTNVTITDNGSSITVNTSISGCDICASSGNNGAEYHSLESGISSHTFTTDARPLYITVTKHNYIPYTAVVGGTFTSNEYWFGNLHVVCNGINIDNNKTLTILPGTTIKIDGYRSIHIREGSKIIAEGEENNPILFTSLNGNTAQSWKNIFVHGSHNRFKWCEFKYGNWPLKFTGKDTPTIDNLVEHCTFHNNDQAIRIHKNDATISHCEFFDNRHGLVCYSNTEIEFTGNHIHNNKRDGVYSWSGNKLWFGWNVIEENGTGPSSTRNGIYTSYSDVIWLGHYKDAGYNTIRNNIQDEVKAHYGDPFVCTSYPSSGDENAIYDTDGESDPYYEVYNHPGNDWIDALFCWWGDDITPQISGDVITSLKLTTEPDWLGSTGEGGSSKIIGPLHTEPILGPTLNQVSSTGAGKSNGNGIETDDIEKKIAELKKIITENPRSLEAERALSELYAILRSDFTENTLNQKNSFYSFLQHIFENNKNIRLGSLALQKMIIWKQLENDNETAIKLSEMGLKILSHEDRMCVLENLVMLYIENGKLDIAKRYLEECKKKYNFDEAGIEFLEEELVDVSEEISKGKNIAKGKGEEQQASQDSSEQDTVEKLALEQNYPNPGNPSTTIHYHIPQSGQVTLKIINILGQEIKTLVDTKKNAGSYTVIWDGTNNQGNQVPSGIYLYLLQTKNKVITKKMLLMK